MPISALFRAPDGKQYTLTTLCSSSVVAVIVPLKIEKDPWGNLFPSENRKREVFKTMCDSRAFMIVWINVFLIHGVQKDMLHGTCCLNYWFLVLCSGETVWLGVIVVMSVEGMIYCTERLVKKVRREHELDVSWCRMCSNIVVANGQPWHHREWAHCSPHEGHKKSQRHLEQDKDSSQLYTIQRLESNCSEWTWILKTLMWFLGRVRLVLKITKGTSLLIGPF